MILTRKKRIKNRHHPEITLTPLIDTALVLLVMFMIAAPIINNGLNIDLPKSNVNENQSNNNQDLIVYIDKNESLYINDEKIELEDLVLKLENLVGSRRHQKVYVNGDKAIPYGALILVVDKIKFISGVDHVILSTERT